MPAQLNISSPYRTNAGARITGQPSLAWRYRRHTELRIIRTHIRTPTVNPEYNRLGNVMSVLGFRN